MPTNYFQAALRITASPCSGMTIADLSNYDGPDATYLKSEFQHYRKVIVTYPDTVTTFVFGSLDAMGADEEIQAPDTLPYDDSFFWDKTGNPNGTYTVKLLVIPTFNFNRDHEVGDIVYDPEDGNIYKLTIDQDAGSDRPSTVNEAWTQITEAEVTSTYYAETTQDMTCEDIPEVTVPFTVQDAFSVAVGANGCDTLNFTEVTNYATTDSPGHSITDWDYRKIKVTAPDGSIYIFGTDEVTDADEQIYAYSEAGFASVVAYTNTYGDGLFTVTLVSVPTYDDGNTYKSGAAVYSEGLFYKATADIQLAQVPGVSADWTEVTEATLPAAYTVTEYIVATCDLDEAYEDALTTVNSAQCKNPCDKDRLCKDRSFLKMIQLMLIKKGVEIAVDNEEWEKANKLITASKKIICC